MKLTSTAFEEGGMIPSKYTCDGSNVNPPLEIHDAPPGTVNLALTMTDPDAPTGTFTHWLLWNIPPTTGLIDEGHAPPEAEMGINDTGSAGYFGPCPPHDMHHYHFVIYALDIVLQLDRHVSREHLEQALAGHVLDQAELIGLYKRR